MAELKEAILATVDPIASLAGKVTTGGRLNAANLVESLAPPQPAIPLALISGSEFTEILEGTVADEALYGFDGDDTIYGRAGNDMLEGGTGNDLLDGGAGGDFFFGGQGDDVYYLDSADDRVAEAIGEGIDTIVATFDITLGDHFERLVLTGTADINGTGNALDNYVRGAGGDNMLFGGAGDDFLEGYRGDDFLDGGSGNDTIEGDNGNDTLDGGLGADTLIGGKGNDVYFVDNRNDVIVEELARGMDSVFASVTVTLSLALENLTLLEEAGAQDLHGHNNSNTLIGNESDNLVAAGRGRDVVEGRGGDDILRGGGGKDTIFGGDGDDEIRGGASVDYLTGGAGADRFVFGTEGAPRMDTVMDFEAGDKIVMDGIGLSSIDTVADGLIARFTSGHSVKLLGLAEGDLDPETDFLMSFG